MAAEAIAAGITAAAGLGSTIGQSIANSNLNKKNRAWQEKMYDQQYQRNVEMWRMQNAYNLPIEQVKRLREAGLNPNLLYGNGSSSAGLAGDISTADVPNTPTTVPYDFSQANNGLASALAMYQNWQMNNLNMDKVKSEQRNIDQSTALLQERTYGEQYKNKLLGIDLSWADKNYAINYLQKQFDIGYKQAETMYTYAKKRESELNFYQQQASFDTRMALLTAQVFGAEASALQSIGQFRESLDKIQSGLYGSQAFLNRSQGSLNNQQYDFQDFYYKNHIPVPSGSLMGLPQTFLGHAGNAVNSAVDWIGKKVEDARQYFKRK